MKQALIVIEEIKRYVNAAKKSKSKHLKNDYEKHINMLKKELKEYCSYKNINYNGLLKEVLENE